MRASISDEAPAPPAPPPPPPPPPNGNATKLFGSGFEGAIQLLPLLDCWGTCCWQDIVGLDSITNFDWPSNIGNGIGKFLMLSDPSNTTPLTMGDYMFNRIESTTGPRGSQSKVLYQEISKNGTEPMGTAPVQNEFQFLPKEDIRDMYVSFWVKLQPDLVEKMTNLPAGPGINNGGTWRAFFALKTGSQKPDGGPANDGDYRVETYIMTYGGSQPYWAVLGDNNAGGGAPRVNSWNVENRQVPVPVGRWFKFEIFWHRSSGDDGRVWMAADGEVIADRYGPNMGAWDMPINRIMAPMLYSGSRMPIYQWIDDIEVWDGFPPASGDNQPYAAH